EVGKALAEALLERAKRERFVNWRGAAGWRGLQGAHFVRGFCGYGLSRFRLGRGFARRANIRAAKFVFERERQRARATQMSPANPQPAASSSTPRIDAFYDKRSALTLPMLPPGTTRFTITLN